MPDAFESLRIGRSAMTPSADFAGRLLGRIREELGMTTTTTGVRDLYYATLTVDGDLDRSLRFFEQLFGWRPTGESHVDGEIRYESLNTTPPMGINNDAGTTNLYFVADDLEEALASVVAAGGTYELAPSGESAGCTDDQGVRFGLGRTTHGPVEPLATIPAGNIGYVTLNVPDEAAGRRFYGQVLGWRFDGGLSNPGFTSVPMGLDGGADPGHTIFVKVEDAAATADRVRELGGTAGTLEESPSGITVACTDDQGTAFALWQPAPGY